MGDGLRATRYDDLPDLREIERAAGELFRPLGMDLVADDEPPSVDELGQYVAAGRSWVVERDGRVVAYLTAAVVDGCGHIEQVTVHPDHAGRRLGAALLDHAASWAAGQNLAALTLTTFRFVPWNGPYYERCGFRWLAVGAIGVELRTVRALEAARGLDAWPRGAMRRDLTHAGPQQPQPIRRSPPGTCTCPRRTRPRPDSPP